MATQSTTAIITLVRGPLSFRAGTLVFKRDQPVPVAMTERTAKLIAQCRSSSNFSVQMPSKKAGVKPAKPSKRVVEEVEETEEEETEAEEEGEEEAEAEADTEEAAEAWTRKSLKSLSKKELLGVAKELTVKLDAKAARSAIIDAILEAQG
jgi:hypothetical protein